MPSQFDRRTALRTVGSAATVALAGCGADRAEDPNGSANGSGASTPAPVTADEFAFEVSVTGEFADDHPARIRAALRNTAADPITVFTGVTPPFASYLSDTESDTDRLVLVPEIANDEGPLDWSGGTVPISETVESGCWNATRDVAIEHQGRYAEVAPGAAISQRYTAYGYQNEPCLLDGTYAFVDSATLTRGPPGDDAPESEAEIGFTIVLNDGSLSVEGDDAVITEDGDA